MNFFDQNDKQLISQKCKKKITVRSCNYRIFYIYENNANKLCNVSLKFKMTVVNICLNLIPNFVLDFD